jgi:hypothetical protein
MRGHEALMEPSPYAIPSRKLTIGWPAKKRNQFNGDHLTDDENV